MKLIEKLAAVASECKIDKDMKVGTDRTDKTKTYAARSEERVLQVMSPLFEKQRVFPLITNIETVFVSELFIKIKLEVTFFDLDSEEKIVTYGLGTGYDRGDKDSGKALTYAFKNCLLKVGLTVSGEDTDNEHTEDIIGKLKGEAVKNMMELKKRGYFLDQASKAGDPKREDSMYLSRTAALDSMGLKELNDIIAKTAAVLNEWKQ